MKIFVLHYSKLVDRKKHILEQFKKQNITDYEFIEKYDKDDRYNVLNVIKVFICKDIYTFYKNCLNYRTFF